MKSAPPKKDGRGKAQPAAERDAAELLEQLVHLEYVTAASAQMLRRFMSRWNVTVFEALLGTGIMDEATYANAVSSVLKIDRLYHLGTLKLAEETLEFFTFQRARAWLALPLRVESAQGPGLEVVMADPTQYDRIEEIKRGLKREFTLAVADRGDMVRAIDELYPLASQLPSLFKAK